MTLRAIDIWDPADAIAGATRYLVASGARGDCRRALLAYNHADWYVTRVLAQADAYRNIATSTAPTVAPVEGEDPVAYAARYLGGPYA